MQTINVRKLQRNMKEISNKVQQGESFAVFKNSDLIFQINPAPKQFIQNKRRKEKEITTLHKIFKNIQFKSEDKNLSKKVDTIIYK